MGAREALEAGLQARWSRDELAVYADALIAEGDVRGELIALDLHREPRPLPTKRSRQRLALLARWLGEALAEPAYDLVRCGFVDTRPDAGEAVLAVIDRASPYVRSIDFLGYSHAELRALVEKLAGAPRPWLARLAISLDGDATRRGPIIDVPLTARLIAATPRLAELEIEARDLFEAFPHPAVERLRASHRGIRTLAGDNAIAMPAVTSLDLALSERFDYAPLDPAALPRLLPPAALPALTRLDVSRNEPGLLLPVHRGFDADVFALLAGWPICARLTHLRVPALHRDADHAELAGLLARTPGLVEVEIARGYPDMEPLLPWLAQLPRVRPPRWLWPWPHRFGGGEALVFDRAVTIKMQPLAAALEDRYDAMPEDARAAWSRLWALVRPMIHLETRAFPRHVLEIAAAALPDVPNSRWSELRARLADEPTPAGPRHTRDTETVDITRRTR